jgi:hypothetical protein
MAGSTTVNGATFLTVPANSRWHGTVTLAASLTASGSTAAKESHPYIAVVGKAANFADGDEIVGLALATPAVSVTATLGTSVTDSVSTGLMVIQTHDDPVSLTLNFATAGTSARATAAGGVI